MNPIGGLLEELADEQQENSVAISTVIAYVW